MRIAVSLAGWVFAGLLGACASAPKSPVPEPAAAPRPAAATAPKPDAAATAAAGPVGVEKDTLAHLERIRAIKPAADVKAADQYNKQLAEAWKFFGANSKASVPVLRQQLALELKKPTPNEFFLLDIGYFLYQGGTAADKELAKTALYQLDPRAEIVRFNQQELFQFAHAVASDRDPRVLALLDAAFLRQKLAVRVPEQDLTLDDTLLCVFLYGAYGSGVENHLKSQLGDKALARKILEILIWVGSPASNPEVRAAMAGAGRDYEMFARTATFLMTVGGPQGRAIMLGVKPENLDVWNQSYYGKIHAPVQSASFATLRKAIADAGDDTGMLESTRPRDALIAELVRGRERSLKTVSTESLAEVKRANALINALRYREK
jgi:hypothetical protein